MSRLSTLTRRRYFARDPRDNNYRSEKVTMSERHDSRADICEDAISRAGKAAEKVTRGGRTREC